MKTGTIIGLLAVFGIGGYLWYRSKKGAALAAVEAPKPTYVEPQYQELTIGGVLNVWVPKVGYVPKTQVEAVAGAVKPAYLEKEMYGEIYVWVPDRGYIPKSEFAPTG